MKIKKLLQDLIKAVRGVKGEEEDVYTYGIPLAAACVFESDHQALRNVGQGHVVLEEGGEEEGSAGSRAHC